MPVAVVLSLSRVWVVAQGARIIGPMRVPVSQPIFHSLLRSGTGALWPEVFQPVPGRFFGCRLALLSCGHALAVSLAGLCPLCLPLLFGQCLELLAPLFSTLLEPALACVAVDAHQLPLTLPAPLIVDLLVFLIMLATKRIELVSVEDSVPDVWVAYSLRGCPAGFVLLPLQNELECFFSALPGFGSLAMAGAYFIACGCSAVLALGVEDFLGQRYCGIAVQTLESVAAVIYSLRQTCVGQRLIGEIRPPFTNP